MIENTPHPFVLALVANAFTHTLSRQDNVCTSHHAS